MLPLRGAATQRCCHSEVLPLGRQHCVGHGGGRLHGVGDGVGYGVAEPRGVQLLVVRRLQVQGVPPLQALVRLAVVVEVGRTAEAAWEGGAVRGGNSLLI